jgi:hypothetical protein
LGYLLLVWKIGQPISVRVDPMTINSFVPAVSGSVAVSAQSMIIEVSRAAFSRSRAAVVPLYAGR